MNLVRSYKIRGAYNLMSQLTKEEKVRGVICASAGNHAQGFAYACQVLKIKGYVYMPEVTPRQKIDKVSFFGKEYVEIILIGLTYDDCYTKAKEFGDNHNLVFVHPFDDERTITGQASVAIEILEDIPDIDIIICPVGGGGLISGVSNYTKMINSNIKIFGCDPEGAPKAVKAFEANNPIKLENIDTFVDGAAVKKLGEINFKIMKKYVDDAKIVPHGAICTQMINLYQYEGIITEPAGALSIAGLEIYKKEIKGKKVVCMISGGNNDISRYPEIIEKSMIYEGLKKYFIIKFNQKPGELSKFLSKVLDNNEDIVRFEYLKKNNKESGPALVGIELQKRDDFDRLISRMKEIGINYRDITDDSILFQYLV